MPVFKGIALAPDTVLPPEIRYAALHRYPGAGQSDYDERNTEGGLLMPQFNVRAYPEVFQIYQTGRRIAP